MEIQDRNNLLQILVGAKENKPQVSFDGDSFVDVLNLSQVKSDKVSKDSASVEFKDSGRKNISFSTKEADKVFADNNKEVSKKVENKSVDAGKKNDNKPKEKEEVKEENAVAANQGIKDEQPVSEKEEVINSRDADTAAVDEAIVTDETSQTQILPQAVAVQGVDEAVLDNLLQGEVVEDVVEAVDNGFVAVLNNVEDMPIDEELMNTDVKKSTLPNEAFTPVSEDEALLMEQAKFFDENVATNKKLKIGVNVTEEKIADTMVKDVLKNRFEIDSMFQMVDAAPVDDMTELNAEVVLDEVVQDNIENTKVSSDIKNSFVGDVKTIQEAVKTASIKDMTVTSVSAKEVVAEVANVSRNEAFVKINETVARDNYKGMSKEVIEQIKINITKSAIKGVDTIDIQLSPEDLGKVQVKMYIGKDGKVQAEVVSSRAETADMLQKDVSSLSKAFNDAGYDTDAKSFTFSFQNENQAKGQERDDSGLLKFIGDTLEQEAENVAGNDNHGYDPVLGLNIRV